MNHLSPNARCLLAFFLAAFLSHAQATPGIASQLAQPASAESQAPAPPEPPVEALIASLRQKLAAASEDLAQATEHESAPSPGEVAAAGEITEAGLLRQQLVRIYQRQIDSLQKLQSLRQSRAQLERESKGWTGLKAPPPYSFLFVDELREAIRSQQARIQALTQMDVLIDQEDSRRKEFLQESAEKLRQANERLESQAGADPRLVWLRDLDALRNHAAEAQVEMMRGERLLNDEELAVARQRLGLTGLQLNEAKNHLSFPPADQDQVRARLAAERQSLQAELVAAFPDLEATRKAAQESTAALERMREPQAKGDDPARLAALEKQAEIQRTRTENADIKLQMLNRLLDAVKAREKIWELRWSPVQDAQAAIEARGRIDKIRQEFRPMHEYVAQHLMLTVGQTADQEQQSLDPGTPALAAHHEQLRALYGEREAAYRRMQWGTENNLHLLDLWQQDLDDRHQDKPWAGRVRDRLAQTSDTLDDVWEYELFAVEDTIVVEGQPMTGKRSVTLGKVLTALLILVVGLWLSAKLSLHVERIAIRRAGIDESAARIARRWLLFLIGVILVMTSMVMVKIPLTVFAFTGGALAIGAGFGMQNLLKNLISGLMLLLERPFRPGDLVEVSGIRGRVIDIGMRSSHIRDANGIETLIPNSNFIEENVTNWTLSSQSVRIVVKLGVAYGSPVQELTDLLLETAGRHGLIQDKPPPEVLFEDFGSDALLFGLYVWVEIKPGVDWRAIASDLRFMIYKTLAARDIVMAFPQRDIHLDTARPLEVRVLKETRG